MQITLKTSQDDWFAFNQHILTQRPKTHRTWLDNPWIMTPCWVVLALLLLFIFGLNDHFHAPTALAVSIYLVVFIGALILNAKLKQQAFAPDPQGTFVGEHTFVFDETGIASSGDGYHAQHAWRLVKKIERISQRVSNSDRKLILVYLDTCFAYIFPESQLENPDDFYQQINHYIQQSK